MTKPTILESRPSFANLHRGEVPWLAAALIGVAAFAACGSGKTTPTDTDDGIVHILPGVPSTAQRDLAECRAQIRTAICVPSMLSGCSPESTDFAPAFEQTFDALPPFLQRMFCGIDTIDVLTTNQAFSAYTDATYGPDGAVTGAILAVNAAVLQHGDSASAHLTRSEQHLLFAGEDGADYPQLRFSLSAAGDNQLLTFVIVHEMGHMFDMANAVNEVACESPLAVSGNVMYIRHQLTTYVAAHPEATYESFSCHFVGQRSWSRFSWEEAFSMHDASGGGFTPDFSPRGVDHYQGFDELFSANPAPDGLTPEAVAPLYTTLATTTHFATLYSSHDPLEDWAESFALYVLHADRDLLHNADAGSGVSFDSVAKLHDALFAEKRAAIDAFLSGPFAYPH